MRLQYTDSVTYKKINGPGSLSSFDMAIFGQLGFVRTVDILYVRLLCSANLKDWKENFR